MFYLFLLCLTITNVCFAFNSNITTTKALEFLRKNGNELNYYDIFCGIHRPLNNHSKQSDLLKATSSSHDVHLDHSHQSLYYQSV